MAWTSLNFAFGSILTSTQMTQLQANFEATASGLAGAPRVLGTDNWFRFAGGDGDLTVNSDTILTNGVYNYDNITVNSGKTLTVTSGQHALILRAKSSITVEGTINMEGRGAYGARASEDGTPVLAGTFTNSSRHDGILIAGGSASGGGASTSQGGNAGYMGVTENGTTGNGSTHPITRTSLWDIRIGAGGGSIVIVNSGGDGGGCLILASPSIHINSGTLDASGTGSTGNLGGGGGGMIKIITSAESYTNNGTIVVSGGASGGGGDGGTGIIEIIQLT